MKITCNVLSVLLTFFISNYCIAQKNCYLDFDGSNDYITLGKATDLGTNTFTLEAKIFIKGSGATASSGSGGISIQPIIAKGRGEADGDNRDCNYIFGVDANGKLGADFEEINTGTSPGLNHPIIGKTTLSNNKWYHVAVTYDGVRWKLYIDGVLDNQDSIGRTPQGGSIQHFAIGTAMNSSGQAQGYFQGSIDEARVWNYARSAQQIKDSQSVSFASANGLIGCFRLNEGTGSTTKNEGSASSSTSGTLTNSPTWVCVGPPNKTPYLKYRNPYSPNTSVDSPVQFKALYGDDDKDTLIIEFWARRKPKPITAPNFTIIPLPDMQFYHEQSNGATDKIARAQMDWIVNNKKSLNIVYAIQLGDCVQNGDNNGNDIEWRRADTTFRIIEDTSKTHLDDGLPYGICVGNHDQSPGGDARGATKFYNQYFGEKRFKGRKYYGGNYNSKDNDNHYQLFSASGMDFISISFEYDLSQDTNVLNWADSLLKAYKNRRAILSTHYFINNDGSWGNQGKKIYDRLKVNPNLFLLLCGHVCEEARRTDVYQGNTTYTLLSDYQCRTKGGNGWLRIMEFNPSKNEISVKTYSPTLNQYETDASSQFTLSYNMTPVYPFKLIGTDTSYHDSDTASIYWNQASPDSGEYEWYSVARDKYSTQSTDTFAFEVTRKITTNITSILTKNHLNNLIIIPNPVTDNSFSIKMNNNQHLTNTTIKMYDLNGRLINIQSKINSSDNTINVQLGKSVSQGSYYLQATSMEGIIYSGKVIVK